MKNLEDYTEKELLQAIENKKRKESTPKQLDKINWERVLENARYRATEIAINARAPKHSVQYIFEEVMSAVYGEDYFKWENKANKGE